MCLLSLTACASCAERVVRDGEAPVGVARLLQALGCCGVEAGNTEAGLRLAAIAAVRWPARQPPAGLRRELIARIADHLFARDVHLAGALLQLPGTSWASPPLSAGQVDELDDEAARWLERRRLWWVR